MIVEVCQRWCLGRGTYRPVGEPIRTRDYEVAEMLADRDAKEFVVTNHYSRSFVAAKRRFGLYCGGALVGVAVYSEVWDRVARAALPGIDARDCWELSRLVLLPEVPANGESWFLARTRALLRGDVAVILSHSDDVARIDAGGDLVFPGHLGVIYQASNAVHIGRARPNTLYVFADGAVFSQRAQSKIRSRAQGWRYASRLLESRGARALGAREDARLWLSKWRETLCVRLRHPGCLRYLWAIDKAIAKMLPDALPYPKVRAGGAALSRRRDSAMLAA